MPVCPSCDVASEAGALACPTCGLAVELFDPVRQVVGVPRSDPRYAEQVGALIEALGNLALPATPEGGAGPSNGGSTAAEPPEPVPEDLRIHEVPLPPPVAPEIDVARRRIADYLDLAGRTGLDGISLDPVTRERVQVDDLATLDAIERDLFVRVSAGLTDRYESLLPRRTALASFGPTEGIDARLAAGRGHLEAGELAASGERLVEASDALTAAETEWAPVRTLLIEARTLAEGVRRFGGDPAGALGPLQEGERHAKAGERAPAENLLTTATIGLWALLNPLLTRDLAGRVAALKELKAGGVEVGPVMTEMLAFNRAVKERRYADAIAAYQRAGSALRTIAPPDPAGPRI